MTKYVMRFHDLFEAPISNYQVHGMDEPGSFPDVDRRNLTSPQHVQKVTKHFADTEHNYSLFFTNMKGKNYVNTVPGRPDDFSDEWKNMGAEAAGLTSVEGIQRITGVTIQPDANAINVVFISNANVQNTVSMTPWIMAHRIGHALTDRVESLPSAASSLLRKLPDGGSTVATFNPRVATGEQQKRLSVSTRQAMTMRSARTGNLNSGEEREELFAQFLMRGSVTLELRGDYAPNVLRSINAQLVQKSREIEDVLNQVLDLCVGHLFLAI